MWSSLVNFKVFHSPNRINELSIEASTCACAPLKQISCLGLNMMMYLDLHSCVTIITNLCKEVMMIIYCNRCTVKVWKYKLLDHLSKNAQYRCIETRRIVYKHWPGQFTALQKIYHP